MIDMEYKNESKVKIDFAYIDEFNNESRFRDSNSIRIISRRV